MQQCDHEGTPGTPGEVELDAVARICAERHVQMQNSFDCLSAVANGSAIARSRSSCHTTRNISENTPSRNAANGTKALANSATLSLGHALQPTVQHTTYVRAKIPAAAALPCVLTRGWLTQPGWACLHVRSSVA